MTSYIVLRDLSRTVTAEPFALPNALDRLLRGRATGSRADLDSAAPAPKLEVEELSARDVSRRANDRSVVAIARSMPIKLIRARASAEAPTAGATWGVSAVGAEASPFDGTGVAVAVLDTGIDARHPAFAGVAIEEMDFTGEGNGDREGHGTHCAGTIFGRDVQGTRIGVARGVTKAHIGKVLGQNGGDSDMLFRGMQWAFDKGSHVISMSLGFDFPGLVDQLVGEGWPVPAATSVALEAYRANLRVFDAMMAMFQARAAFGTGTVVIAAAGNESERSANPPFEIAASVPAAANLVLSVGALGRRSAELEIAPFSNTFPNVSAPGVDIVSAQAGGGLVAFNGTSMACPHVAGVAALWWQRALAAGVPNPADDVRARVLTSGRMDDFAAGIDQSDVGEGLVSAPAGA